MCTNTEGSFFCSCDTGYSLDSNRLNCSGMHMHACKQYDGTYIVHFTLKSHSCSKMLLIIWNYVCSLADINECLTDNGGCEQICNNTEGSFSCSCDSGYNLDSNRLNCTGITDFL